MRAPSLLVRPRRHRLMVTLGLMLLVAPAADAQTSEPAAAMSGRITHRRVIPYPLDVVWPTAVRYLRVDRGFAIVDRDRDAGYVLFEFKEGKGAGSIEAFATEDDAGRPSVNLQVGTSGGPMHLPNTLAEGIAKKLREERGQPAPPPSKTPEPDAPSPPPDQGDSPFVSQ